MKKGYKILLIIGIVVAVLVVAGVVAFSSIENSLEALKDMSIAEADLSTVPDGVYAGSYSEFPVAADVTVTVSDHVITNIVLVHHENGQGQAAEAIPQIVVEAQSLQVDTISSATYSSKVILKAIEDALVNQRKG